jgi:hypothetical protein
VARSFTRGSSEYLEHAAAALTAAPITLACWAYVLDTTNTHTLMSLGDAGTAVNGFHLQARGATGGDPVTARTNNANADSASGYPANTWFHAAAVFAASNSRFAYLNGTAGTEQTGSATPAPEVTSIGRRNNTTQDYLDGSVAEAAIWNVALTAAEIAALAQGVSPLFVRAGNLVAYWPLLGRTSPEIDRVGRFDLTATGTVAIAHPRMVGRPSTVHVERRTTGATAYTLDAAPGSYAITGAAAAPLAARLVSADPATYAVTGAAMATIAARSLVADPGTLAITGAAASLLATRVLAGDPGALTITGAASTVLAAHLLVADPGTLTLDGEDAELDHATAGDYVLNADPGSYSLTGLAAGLTAVRSLPADPGAYAMTGQAASLTATRRLEALPGTYVATGEVAGLYVGRALSADPGAYQATGAVAGLVATRVLAAVPGLYLLTGSAATLLAGSGITLGDIRHGTVRILTPTRTVLALTPRRTTVLAE